MEGSDKRKWIENQVIKHDEHGRPYVQISKGFNCRVEYDELSEEDKLRALYELRETPENVKAGLEKLRELLKADNHLFVPSDFDDFLMPFLRRTKFYPESAYKLMRTYYKFKVKHSSYCGNLLPTTDKLAFIHGVIESQPLRTITNSRIFIMKLGQWDPSQLPLVDFFRTMNLGLQTISFEPVTQVNGFVVIYDTAGLSFRQIVQFTPFFAKIFLDWIQDCIPLRLKAIHIVYNSPWFEIMFAMFKPFVRSKMRKRVFFHGTNLKKLVASVGADRLRPRYGGTMPCDIVDGTKLAELFEEDLEEFELANAFGLVENKNVGMPSIVPVTAGKVGPKYALGL